MFHRKPKTDLSPAELETQVASYTQRCDLLVDCARSLIYLLKEFSFDLAEIDAPGYKKQLDDLAKTFSTDSSTNIIQKSFDKNKKSILDFALQEKTYFDEKEFEFRKIINILHNGIEAMSGENQTFNSQIYERNLRIEQATNLTDIRLMREKLKTEVSQITDIIRKKQFKDTEKLDLLSKEVDFLKSHLEIVKDASVTDSLTGVYNRLGFDTFIQRGIERNKISWEPFSILLCDLDDFKVINDTLGHQVGDAVLLLFVKECKALVRDSDIISRYGGDEFICVLPGANLRNATKKAQIIQKKLASKQFIISHMNSNHNIKINVSIGVSQIAENDSSEELFRRADAALYHAKKSGKNCVVSEREILKSITKNHSELSHR